MEPVSSSTSVISRLLNPAQDEAVTVSSAIPRAAIKVRFTPAWPVMQALRISVPSVTLCTVAPG